MSDLIEKKKLLNWLDNEADDQNYGAIYTKIIGIFKEIKSGTFDAPSERSEVQRLREALEAAQMNLMKANPQHALMDIEDALATQSEMVIE